MAGSYSLSGSSCEIMLRKPRMLSTPINALLMYLQANVKYNR